MTDREPDRDLRGRVAIKPQSTQAVDVNTGTREQCFSQELDLPQADALAGRIIEEVGHLTAADFPVVRDYAIAQLRAWHLAEYLELHGDFDARGRPRPALELLRRWLERAERARARIGLDPVSRAALDVDRTLAADRVRDWARTDLAEGERLRREAERRGALRAVEEKSP